MKIPCQERERERWALASLFDYCPRTQSVRHGHGGATLSENARAVRVGGGGWGRERESNLLNWRNNESNLKRRPKTHKGRHCDDDFSGLV